MEACSDLASFGLIKSVKDGYPYPELTKGYFRTPYYVICLKDDIILEPHSSSVQSTGIIMEVPKHCIAVVQTAYKPNACLVEERYYAHSHGEFELKLKCENPTEERVHVYGSFQIAHLFLYQLNDNK